MEMELEFVMFCPGGHSKEEQNSIGQRAKATKRSGEESSRGSGRAVGLEGCQSQMSQRIPGVRILEGWMESWALSSRKLEARTVAFQLSK